MCKKDLPTGGFRGGAEGTSPPFFLLYFQSVLPLTLRFCFEMLFNSVFRNVNLTLLCIADSIRSQCCMLHVLKSEVFIRSKGRGGGDGGLGPLFLNFLDPSLLPFNTSILNRELSGRKTDILTKFDVLVLKVNYNIAIC